MADRFTDSDFASVWEHMAGNVRKSISQADFVELYQTCKTTGARLYVTGVRLQPDGQAIVRMARHGGKDGFRFMIYENGAWNMRATDEFAARLGQPLQKIIDEERAAGLCDK